MHEWITVYVDEENILRADHNLNFYGLPFLKLHYKITEKHNNQHGISQVRIAESQFSG